MADTIQLVYTTNRLRRVDRSVRHVHDVLTIVRWRYFGDRPVMADRERGCGGLRSEEDTSGLPSPHLKPHDGFFFNDTATTEIYTLSLHDALPISRRSYHRSMAIFRRSTRDGGQGERLRRV